jgi:hypothetical protein
VALGAAAKNPGDSVGAADRSSLRELFQTRSLNQSEAFGRAGMPAADLTRQFPAARTSSPATPMGATSPTPTEPLPPLAEAASDPQGSKEPPSLNEPSRLSSWDRKRLMSDMALAAGEVMSPFSKAVADHSRPSRIYTRPTTEVIEETSTAERRQSCRYRVRGLIALLTWPEPQQKRPASSYAEPRSGSSVRPPRTPSAQGFRAPRIASTRAPDLGAEIEFVRDEVVVLDLSQTGLSMTACRLPNHDRGLWIGLRDADPIAWFEVALRSVSEPKPGAFLLRVSFVDHCPYDMIRFALLNSN